MHACLLLFPTTSTYQVVCPHTFMFSTLYRRVLLPVVERVRVRDVVLAAML